MENCFVEDKKDGIVEEHLSSIKNIFTEIQAHLSDLNEKTIGCLVPMILRSEEPQDLIVPLFKDAGDEV